MLSFVAFLLFYAPYELCHFVSYAFYFIKTLAVNDKWVPSQLCIPQQERFLNIRFFFLAVPWGCLRFVTVVLPDHTHLLFSTAVLITVDICFDFRVLPLPRQI